MAKSPNSSRIHRINTRTEDNKATITGSEEAIDLIFEAILSQAGEIKRVSFEHPDGTIETIDSESEKFKN